MSKLYSIQESTLTDIGDALRSKYGETRPGTILVPCVISKTSNATGPYTWDGPFPANGVQYYNIRIPGATRIEVDLYYFTTSISCAAFWIAAGEYNNNNPLSSSGLTTYCGYQSVQNKKLTFDNTDVITIKYEGYTATDALGFYAICMGYDSNDNIIEFENCDYAEQEVIVPNTYSSADVAAAIEGLVLPPEPIVLTNNQSYGCSGALAGIYINIFGNTITTKDIYNTNNMFDSNNIVEYIPFDININAATSRNMNNMFYGCESLKELPKIYNARPQSVNYIFYNCKSLKEIPEDFSDTWNFNDLHTQTYYYLSHTFELCCALRKIPKSFLKEIYNKGNSTSYAPYYYMFRECYALDEIDGLPIQNATITSNMFTYAFNNCSRLKRIVFNLQEDGSPYVVNWKSQVIDLSYGVRIGYAYSIHWIIDYSDITADKKVNNDATYQALKNDPDWFTVDSTYSRYNHDSAVETINSLPDTSAYLAANGGTNTIKFNSNSGSATDGGAINTLTEEEIAVATAKGWTVSFA